MLNAICNRLFHVSLAQDNMNESLLFSKENVKRLKLLNFI